MPIALTFPHSGAGRPSTAGRIGESAGGGETQPVVRGATRHVAGRQPRVPVALVAAVFLSTYITWRPLAIMFTFSDALFILSGALLLLRRRLPGRPLGPLMPFWMLSFSLLILGLLVGSLVNGDPVRWLIVASQYGFAWLVLPVLLIGHGHDNTTLLIKSLLAGMFGMQLFAALVYYAFDGTALEAQAIFGHDFIAGNRRVAAFLADANWNAAAISMSLMFALYCGVRRLMGTAIVVVLVAVLSLGLLLTASFTGFASTVSALVIFCVIAGIRPGLRTVLALAAAAAILVQAGYGLPKAFESRVAGALTTGDISQAGTYEGRMGLMEEAWEMVGERILIGVGVDQFRVVSSHGAPVHNMYLLIWAEGGLASLTGWLGMLVTLAVAAVFTYRQDRVAAALTASIAWIFIVFSTANPHMYNRLWAVPVLLALAVAMPALSRREAPARA